MKKRQASICEYDLCLPGGAGQNDITFEAVPDMDVSDFTGRICRARILSPGRALPCLHHANPMSREVYSKTPDDDTMPFNNFGKIELPRYSVLYS